MKNRLLYLLLFISTLSYAQVGTGTNTPDPSAQLEVVVIDKGVLVSQVLSISLVNSPVRLKACWFTKLQARKAFIFRMAAFGRKWAKTPCHLAAPSPLLPVTCPFRTQLPLQAMYLDLALY